MTFCVSVRSFVRSFVFLGWENVGVFVLFGVRRGKANAPRCAIVRARVM